MQQDYGVVVVSQKQYSRDAIEVPSDLETGEGVYKIPHLMVVCEVHQCDRRGNRACGRRHLCFPNTPPPPLTEPLFFIEAATSFANILILGCIILHYSDLASPN